MGLTLTSLT